MSLIQSTSESTSPRIGHSVSHSLSESTSCFSDQSTSHPFCQESLIQSASHITFQSIDQTDSQTVNTSLSLLLDSHLSSQSLSPQVGQRSVHNSVQKPVSLSDGQFQSVSWSVSWLMSQLMSPWILIRQSVNAISQLPGYLISLTIIGQLVSQLEFLFTLIGQC